MSAEGQRIRRAADGFLDSILSFLDQYKDNECFKGLLVDAQLEATELLRIRSRLDLVDSLERPTDEDEQEVCHLKEVYGDLVTTWESVMKANDRTYVAKVVRGTPVFNRGENDRARCAYGKSV